MPKLRRISDGYGDSGEISQAMTFNEDGTLKEIVGNRPTIGCAMLVGTKETRFPLGSQEYWQTTEITEIIEDTGDYVKFKTGNSIYEWWLKKQYIK